MRALYILLAVAAVAPSPMAAYAQGAAAIEIDLPTNYPPGAGSRTLAVRPGLPVQIALTGFDAQGDSLTFRITTPPGHGSIDSFDSAQGSLTYVSFTDFVGEDGFDYVVSDGGLESDPAHITLVVAIPDFDADTISDDNDNCPFLSNASQVDRGGIGAASAPDGIGDACQCGDANGDGKVTSTDATLLFNFVRGNPAANPAKPELCDVNHNGACNSTDATIIFNLVRGVSLPPGVFATRCPESPTP